MFNVYFYFMECKVVTWEIVSDEDFDIINGENIRIKVARLGAELISLQTKQNGSWVGLLVNDDDTDPQHHYWKRHAPFLFPIVGGLQNDKSTTSDGKLISLPSHGFARISTFSLVDSGSNESSAWLEYSLSFTESTDLKYPWDTTLTIKYTILNSELLLDITVNNDSKETMWYQFGWHPGFMAPISGDASKRNLAEITVPTGEYILKGITEDCLLTGDDKKLVIDSPLQLSDKELEDTYILDMKSIDNRWLSLYDPESGIKTTVTFDDYPHLGLWALPDSPYICIEPWQGCDDYEKMTPFENKFGIASLDAGQSDKRQISIIIEDKA